MDNFSLNAIDITIIIVCPLLVIIVGLWASRFQEKTAKGYFLAGGKLPWYVIGAAFVSTSVSSEQIVGTVGATYEHGMAIANWEWFGLAYIPLILFFIPMYLKNKVTTVPDFLSRRFGDKCSDVYSWIMLPAYIFIFMVPVFYSGSLAFSQLLGINFYVIVWAMVIIIGLYAIKGGLGSVMYADALQCLMLVGGGVLLFFALLGKIPGGWEAMQQAAPERFHLYQPPEDKIAPFLGLIVGSFGVFLFYQAANQVMIQRVLGARSTWDGIMGIIFAGFINRLRPLVTCFIGLIVFHWIHVMNMAEPLADRDLAFGFAMSEMSPSWGIRGIVLAGFLAAVMSTIGALSNSTSTIFALDVYKKIINPNASDKQLVWIGRTAAMLALCIAAAVCPIVSRFGGIFKYFQMGVTFLATPFISILLMGIFYKRTNYPGAMFGMVGGIILSMGIGFGLKITGQSIDLTRSDWAWLFGLHWLYVAFFVQIITMIGILIVSHMTKPPAPERALPFKWSISMLTGYDDGIKRPWYKSLILWFVILYIIIGITYWYFW